MIETKSNGIKTVSRWQNWKGKSRTVQVETYENGDVEIDLTMKLVNGEELYKVISLNKMEAINLAFHLVKMLMPDKIITNKWQRK